MENEFQILKNIERNKNTTQRDLAKSTGMSLGNVNILIKRLIKKGLLKMDRLNPKTIRYILTPEGIKEKAELTYKYFVISYKYINEINAKIDAIFHDAKLLDKGYIIFGDSDEVYQLVQNNLKQKGVDFKYISSADQLVDFLGASNILKLKHRVIICWGNSFIAALIELKLEYINLLENN